MKFRALLLVTMMSLPGLALANELYVSPSGNDLNSGASSAPLRTIQKAADLAIPGTIIHVAPGTYAETIVSKISGTALEKIRFVSDTKWGAKIVPKDAANIMWSARGGYTEIVGFQVDGRGSNTVRVGIYLNGGNSSVMNSYVHHVAENSGCDNQGGAGLLADQGRGPSYQNYDFLNNLVHNVGNGCGWIQGIYHSSSGNIKNNIVYATSQGINLGHDDHDLNVVNNTVFGNSGYGVRLGGCKEAYNNGCPTYGIKIHNNIIFDNLGGIQGPIAEEDVNNEVKNNVVYGNKINYDLSSQGSSYLSRKGEINADPQFVNYISTGGGDYRLRSTSPAIDKGLASIYAPVTDFDGNARPQGVGIDIGAYEYGATPAPSAPIISSVKTVTFENQLIGTQSAVKYITLTNSGTAPLSFSGVFGISGDFNFGGSGTCTVSSPVAPGASCLVSVVFNPSALGTRSGALSIPSNASSTPLNIALSGTGVAPVDSSAPVTAITAPTHLSSVAVRTYISIQANASDNVGVISVAFYVNGVLRCTVSKAPFACVWKVPSTRRVTYTLQTKAIDAAGNAGFSSKISVISK